MIRYDRSALSSELLAIIDFFVATIVDSATKQTANPIEVCAYLNDQLERLKPTHKNFRQIVLFQLTQNGPLEAHLVSRDGESVVVPIRLESLDKSG